MSARKQKKEEEQQEMNNAVDLINSLVYGNRGGSEAGEEQTGWREGAAPEGTIWDSNKVTAMTDGTDTVPIPKGYVISTIKDNAETTDKNEDETTVSNGLVIYEGEVAPESNQYVWVPVATGNNTSQYGVTPIVNLSNMYGTDSSGNKLGKLYAFNEQGEPIALNWTETDGGNKVMSWTNTSDWGNNNREPVVLKGYNIDTEYVEENWEGMTQEILQTEFSNMIESVEKYGGFYIGRYETGGLNTTKTVIKAGEGVNSIANASWYTMYDKTKALSKTIDGEEITKASIIWGCQYDQMLRFAGCALETTGTKNVSAISSGAVVTDCYKNIYDLCGNVRDWTIEGYWEGNYMDPAFRISRGGDYHIGISASARFGVDTPSARQTDTGSRATLYVAL